ncbi:hypothetical protein HMPREF9137_1852 [Prevotella denticola F0289]|nr:hypothetical protein HMPREF9137_1852 [Prevotella denticola F0289]
MWTGNKTEAYNSGKCPALYICSDRTRMNISAVRQTSSV